MSLLFVGAESKAAAGGPGTADTWRGTFVCCTEVQASMYVCMYVCDFEAKSYHGIMAAFDVSAIPIQRWKLGCPKAGVSRVFPIVESHRILYLGSIIYRWS